MPAGSSAPLQDASDSALMTRSVSNAGLGRSITCRHGSFVCQSQSPDCRFRAGSNTQCDMHSITVPSWGRISLGGPDAASMDPCHWQSGPVPGDRTGLSGFTAHSFSVWGRNLIFRHKRRKYDGRAELYRGPSTPQLLVPARWQHVTNWAFWQLRHLLVTRSAKLPSDIIGFCLQNSE